MKIVTELTSTDVKCRCPECNEIQEGFLGNPRGGTFKCDYCGATYKIHEESDLEYRV